MRDLQLYERILGLPEPWRVEGVHLLEDAGEIVIEVGLRRPLKLACPECGEPMAGYDHRQRRWRHLDTCQYKTIIEANIPRGQCPTHGVRQIQVPWAEGRSHFTALFECLVIDWLREASQIAVARRFGLSWSEAHGIMDRAVRRGLERREGVGVRHIGVDEKSFQRRHEYVTVVCGLEEAKVLYVGEGRGKSSLDGFYASLSHEWLEGIEGVAMDMWEPYISSTRQHAPKAEIVFDKFHVAANLSKAVDKVRKQENRQLMEWGDGSLKGTKYLWLKGRDRFDRAGWRDFAALRDSQLKTARAWAVKETFASFWGYVYRKSAERFFQRWYGWAIRSRLEPIKKAARMLKDHLKGILAYLNHRITNAVTEGINSKIQWIKQTARGFANRDNFRVAILFHCGGLDLYPH